MNAPHPTQLSPALALLQLLTENPTLPAVEWEVRPDGELFGRLWAADTRNASAAFQRILGVERVLMVPYSYRGRLMVSEYMAVIWRDVQVRMSFRSHASAYDVAPLAVTA
ncbi:hypothetical protein ACFC58_36435 [Kitasatospora purpeofusca]|uniref:hypothetical protein n=1 Tax=Kitasatospora purpeofusca TaxID=67352 RepID=UPI0035E36845